MPYVPIEDDEGTIVDDDGIDILCDISVGFDAPILRPTDNRMDATRADSLVNAGRMASLHVVKRPAIGQGE